jgi:peptidoglycan/LPS O-acetylase OafA/YrhL
LKLISKKTLSTEWSAAVPDSPAHGASANLDLLRSVAVLLVLLDHLTRHYHHDRWGDLGYFGVLLFFVHTSLVLMYSMQRSHLTGSALVKDFYIRRFFRIYPLSILAVITALALHLHADGRGLASGSWPGTSEVLSNLFLIQNLTCAKSIIGPLWSLPLEIQMYLFLPFIFLWKKRSVVVLLLAWLVCGALGHFPQTVPALAWFTLLLYVPNFLPGIIAFTLPEKRILPSYLWPMFVLVLTALFFFFPSRRMGGITCLLLGFGIPLFKEITLRPLKFVANCLATYSYGIYLGHSFFIWWALTERSSWILFWLMWLTVPFALYHAFEHPALEVGRRIAERLSLPRQPILAPEPQSAAGTG